MNRTKSCTNIYYPASNFIVEGMIYNSNGEASSDSKQLFYEIFEEIGQNSNTISIGNGPVFLNGNLYFWESVNFILSNSFTTT